VAVSAPLDLNAAGAALDRGISKNIYTRMFLKTLRSKSLAKLARHPGVFDGARVRAATTFREFDDAVTAPLHGFAGYLDYWTRSSSAQFLARIRVPTLVLNARNDPFLPDSALRAVEGLDELPANLTLEFPATGGHVGFPGRGSWLAGRVCGFLSA
jgi:predicted alpha/beta-fold hydrolase